jgi:hypothetical protein
MMSKNKTNQKTFTAKQLKVLECLAVNPNVEDVAKKTRVSKSSIYRWMQEDGSFNCRLVEIRTELLDDTIDQVKGYCYKALRGISDLMDSENESIKLKACTYMYDKALQLKELKEFETRIIQLEMKITKGMKDENSI